MQNKINGPTVKKLTQTVASLKGQLKSGKSSAVTSIDTLRVSLSEYWFSVDGQGNPSGYNGLRNGYFQPGNSGLTKLDQFGQMYELWRLNRAVVSFRTSTGSTQSGMVHLGLDFDATDIPSSIAGVAGLNPVTKCPVWSDQPMSCRVVVPVDRVNRQKWMMTTAGTTPDINSSTGFIACTGTTGPPSAGEIWIDYDIDFAGPVRPGQVTQNRLVSNVVVAKFPVSGIPSIDSTANTGSVGITGTTPDVSSSWAFAYTFTPFDASGHTTLTLTITGLLPKLCYQFLFSGVNTVATPNGSTFQLTNSPTAIHGTEVVTPSKYNALGATYLYESVLGIYRPDGTGILGLQFPFSPISGGSSGWVQNLHDFTFLIASLGAAPFSGASIAS